MEARAMKAGWRLPRDDQDSSPPFFQQDLFFSPAAAKPCPEHTSIPAADAKLGGSQSCSRKINPKREYLVQNVTLWLHFPLKSLLISLSLSWFISILLDLTSYRAVFLMFRQGSNATFGSRCRCFLLSSKTLTPELKNTMAVIPMEVLQSSAIWTSNPDQTRAGASLCVRQSPDRCWFCTATHTHTLVSLISCSPFTHPLILRNSLGCEKSAVPVDKWVEVASAVRWIVAEMHRTPTWSWPSTWRIQPATAHADTVKTLWRLGPGLRRRHPALSPLFWLHEIWKFCLLFVCPVWLEEHCSSFFFTKDVQRRSI